MLQVLQYQKTGEMSVEEVPCPQLRDGHVLVRNVVSVISAGTERTSVETAQASLVGKAKSRPDLVKQVVDNVKREGLIATYQKVQSRLDNYKELGYSSAGVIIESGTDAFRVGDRVACAGTAHHAEYVLVPKHLAAKVPEGVPLDEAAFTTLGAIALQGVRQADVRIGESVAVIGLGLIGLITVEILKANGCRVIGLDISDANFDVAREHGCDDCALSNSGAAPLVDSFTRGLGTDAVIIAASTPSNEPVELALQFARKKSAIVIVGAVGMDIPRSPFYEKELDIRISCSYGPGRYDDQYEIKGIDYPAGYVRWTENRNMQAVLDLMAQRKLLVSPLVTHRFPVQQALKAYDLITGKTNDRSIGIVIEYGGDAPKNIARRVTVNDRKTTPVGKPVVGFIGAGNFAQAYLLPTLKQAKVGLKGVATSGSVNAKSVAKKLGFEYCTTDPAEILADNDINTVFVATHHDTHARFVQEALKHGKHVFVEKPLSINRSELQELSEQYRESSNRVLLVGFNRRFSRAFTSLKAFFGKTGEPYVMTYRVHAGTLPIKHWLQDEKQGGRIIGEACHFIDCMTFLADSLPVQVYAESLSSPNVNVKSSDNVNVSIRFADGSVGNLLYLTNGDNSLPKEYLEVYSGGKTAVLRNFESLDLYGAGKKKSKSLDGTKGHKEEVLHFIKAIQGEEELALSFETMQATTLATFCIHESLQKGVPIKLDE
jgi:polar amino acid transport system substrate-binding protein